jgi:peptidoglycan/LPS O-acetylase OafA/YrhL
MTVLFSLYLDLIRFLASIAVFFSHITNYPFTKEVISSNLGAYGAVAVIIFFVLSGYVIAFVSSTREKTVIKYISARVARLYSVVLIALVLTFVFDHIGMSVNPEFYAIKKVLMKPESWSGYLSSLFFINEYQVFNFNGISPGTNGPYWSLSFEATYYLVAGFLLFSRRVISIPVTILIFILAGKTITVLFPIWGFGYMLFHFREKLVVKNLIGPVILFFFSSIGIVASNKISAHISTDNFGFSFPWGRGPFNRDIVLDYLVAVLFSLNLVSAHNVCRISIAINLKLQRLIRWLGSMTFPLYCIHYPAICLLSAISPWSNTTSLNAIFISMPTLILVTVLTPVCNKLKKFIKVRLFEAKN